MYLMIFDCGTFRFLSTLHIHFTTFFYYFICNVLVIVFCLSLFYFFYLTPCSSFLFWVFWCMSIFFFFFKQKTAYEMRISDWSSDVCSSDLDHVAVFAVGGVVAVVALAVLDLVEHDRRLFAAVGDDLAQRRFHRAQGDDDAVVLVFVDALELTDGLQRTHQGHAAARDHAFFDGCARGVQGVFDAGLLFLHLDLGRGTDLDHRHAAGQLGHALLQLLAVVVRRGLFDLRLDLLDAAFDATGFAGAVDDRGVFLGDLDLLGAAEVLDRGLLQRQADFLGDHGATGEDRHVFEHRLAAVAEARGLHGPHLAESPGRVL